MTITLSESSFEKIKKVRATLELIANIQNSVDMLDSIQCLCNVGFIELSDVLQEIREKAVN